VLNDIAHARELLSAAHVVEYREYLDCGYPADQCGDK